MRSSIKQQAAAIVFISLGSLAGCVSTDVHDLAKTTAANTSLVSSELSGFAKSSRQISDARIESISRLSKANAMADIEFAAFVKSAEAAATIESDRPSGDARYAHLISQIVLLTEQLETDRQQSEQALKAERQQISDTIAKLKPPKAELNALAKDLTTLSEPKDLADYVSFAIEFYNGVRADIAAQNEDVAEDAEATEIAVASSLPSP